MKKLLVFVIAVCIGLVLNSSGFAQEKSGVIELRYSIQFPSTHLQAIASQYFADQINKRTNGRVKIRIYPVGTLSSPDKIYQSIVTGIADMGYSTPTYTSTRFPASGALHVPLKPLTGWVTTHVFQDFYEKYKPKEYNDVHMLFMHACSPYHLASAKVPIRTIEDLKGMRVRASGMEAAAFVKALGGAPQSMSMAEVYEAASKGVVDVLLVPWETQKGWKHADVTKYYTVIPVTLSTGDFVAMNKKKWDSLPKDIQKIFTEVSKEGVEWHAKAWWYADIVGEDYFRKLGGGREVIEIPKGEVEKWEKIVKPLTEAYITEKTAMGLPAAEYVKFAQERTEYWNKHHPTKESVMEWVEKELLKGGK
ncbi:MAG TPA: TRAP transporter substrate-binding protein [Syntrophorhabdaceae bacterium]|nr:TRAP transporter substrate-binding protein [Syntrophorhabdaceae bacterium]HQM81374.1 TRAP transporter substrate-binding protein [Syntrophorhabdaceae bacterium]